MTRNATSFKAGQSGNPKGRPPKKRTLTNLLEKGGNKKFAVGEEQFAAKQLFVQRIWQGLATGHLTYNSPDGQPMVFPLDAQQYIALAKLVLGQVDGPPRAEVDVTSAGKELKASSGVDSMKDIFQLMGQRDKNVPSED
jgi:hypothetical protein